MTGLSIYAHGMLTAAGFNARATCAAMRAGISGIRIDNLYDYTAGRRLTAGRPRTPQWWEGHDMLAEIVAPPITECLAALAGLGSFAEGVAPEQVPIITILPPPDRPHRDALLDREFPGDLAHRLGLAELPLGSYLVPGGRTGIATALALAHEQLAGGRARFVVIAGVESFLRQRIVEHYIENRRLLCEINSNGFIAGEAGCALLVGPSHRSDNAELVISAIASGHERAGTGGDEQQPTSGDGLTKAVRDALTTAGLEYADLEYIVTDLNGERFKFKEALIAAARLDNPRPASRPPRRLGYVDVWHPIEYLGEIGAAVFPCMLGWIFAAGIDTYAPSHVCLSYAGEDNGERVALVTRFKPAGSR
jgi:3-oxoacyl-[acyl-carrier-protein] synthase-1